MYKGSYIQGHFVKVTQVNGTFRAFNPGDLEDKQIEIPFSFEHAQEAATAAKRSFHTFRRLPSADRLNAIKEYQRILKSQSQVTAELISWETGKPLWESTSEVETCVRIIDQFLEQGCRIVAEQKVQNVVPGADGCYRFLPNGAMVVMSPPHLPLVSPHLHFIPALIFGNTIILKPAKDTPLVGQKIAEMFHDAGMFAGAFNLVQGNGELARRLVIHPDVDGLFYSGSHETAIQVRRQVVSDYWKVAVYETSGVNAMVIWEDANYEQALYDTFLASFMTAGQRFSSTSRVLVHKKWIDAFIKDFHQLAKNCAIGYNLSTKSPVPFMGPLMNEQTMEHYVRVQGIAIREGCEEIMRGKVLEREKKGYYVSPSIHMVPAPDTKSIYQKTPFLGPNVAIHQIEDIQQASEILNLPQHNWVTSIYSQSEKNFTALADEALYGQLHWNRPTTEITAMLPIAGIRKSGNQRPMGSFSAYQCNFPVSSIIGPAQLDEASLPKSLPRLNAE